MRGVVDRTGNTDAQAVVAAIDDRTDQVACLSAAPASDPIVAKLVEVARENERCIGARPFKIGYPGLRQATRAERGDNGQLPEQMAHAMLYFA